MTEMNALTQEQEEQFKDLADKRSAHFQSCKDNDDGSHQTIANLYSDPSRFIYELLQNADDTEATEVSFELEQSQLTVTHNGKRPFEIKDISAITTVGHSTKKDELNTIGKFGIGFKSVFAITDSPEIHSGDWHFKITDYIVPKKIEPWVEQGDKTIFIFRFNKDNLYQTVANELKKITKEALLFLRHVKTIHWQNKDQQGSYEAVIAGNKAYLKVIVNSEQTTAHYFLVTKNITISSKKLNIAIAYQLDEENQITKVTKDIFVFFPTKEQTGLNFLVHAPYKTTPSRETIPFDDHENTQITDEVAKLIGDSLIKLKAKGLLKVQTLSLLPIDSENDKAIYQAAFKSVNTQFKNTPLLPTTVGQFVTSDDAILAREQYLPKLLTKQDCKQLFDEEATWLSTEITDDKTRDLKNYLTNKLDIPEIAINKFCDKIDEAFIQSKDDDWLIQFYAEIEDNRALYRSNGVLRQKPIIRLEDSSYCCPCNDEDKLQIYLPTKDGRTSEFKIVKNELITNDTEPFFQALGVKEPDEIAEIKEFILPRYQDSKADSRSCLHRSESLCGDDGDEQYKKDFDQVFAIYSKVEASKQTISNLLKDVSFIPCVNAAGEHHYKKPEAVYFDTKNLKAWFEDNNEDDFYFIKLPFELSAEQRKFIESLGVHYDLKLSGKEPIYEYYYGYYEESVDGFNPAFDIDGLAFALTNISLARSRFLWQLLLKNVKQLRGEIKYKTNQRHAWDKNKKISKALETLEKYDWIYDQNEGLIGRNSRSDYTVQGIHHDYDKDHDDIDKLIKALGLKQDEVKSLEEKYGGKFISNEELQERKKEIEYLRQELAKYQQPQQKPDEPWEPQIKPEDAPLRVDNSPIVPRPKKDLAGQQPTLKNANQRHTSNASPDTSNHFKGSQDNKYTGRRGEQYANRYLQKEYPNNEVVWLNEGSDCGKGYDLVVRDSKGQDIAYFEVKTTKGEEPYPFDVSGTQWQWARALYDQGKGEQYTILRVTNVGTGTKDATIKPINNPVKLWQEGMLYADPVKIEL